MLFFRNQKTILSKVGDKYSKITLFLGNANGFCPSINRSELMMIFPLKAIFCFFNSATISSANCFGGLGVAPEIVIFFAGSVPVICATLLYGVVKIMLLSEVPSVLASFTKCTPSKLILKFLKSLPKVLMSNWFSRQFTPQTPAP